MKKIMTIVLFLGIFITSSVTQAKESNFFSSDWWESATPEQVESAISKGADVKERSKYTETPLMAVATNNQNPKIIDTLIKQGADVKAKDFTGKTALDYAKGNPTVYRTKAYQLLSQKMYE